MFLKLVTLVCAGFAVCQFSHAAPTKATDDDIDPETERTTLNGQSQVDPNSAEAFYDRGCFWIERNEFEKALRDFDDALWLSPKMAVAYVNRGNVWQHLTDPAKAIRDYKDAIRLNPMIALAHLNLGRILYDRGDLKQALAEFNEAVRLDPNDIDSYVIRAYCRHNSGDSENALVDFAKAIQLDANGVYAHYGRGLVSFEAGDCEKPLDAFSESIRIDPDFVAARSAQAWIWSTAANPKYRDGKRAVNAATIACETSHWKDSWGIRVLAAANAESGNSGEGVKEQTRALEMMTAAKVAAEQLKVAVAELAAYKAGMPYRDSRTWRTALQKGPSLLTK